MEEYLKAMQWAENFGVTILDPKSLKTRILFIEAPKGKPLRGHGKRRASSLDSDFTHIPFKSPLHLADI